MRGWAGRGGGERSAAPGRPAVLAMAAAGAAGLWGLSARRLGAGGEPLQLGSLRGKVLLVVNVASL